MGDQKNNIFDYALIGMAVCLGAFLIIPFGFFAIVGLVVSVPFLIYKIIDKHQKEKEREREIQEEREREEKERWVSRMHQLRKDL